MTQASVRPKPARRRGSRPRLAPRVRVRGRVIRLPSGRTTAYRPLARSRRACRGDAAILAAGGAVVLGFARGEASARLDAGFANSGPPGRAGPDAEGPAGPPVAALLDGRRARAAVRDPLRRRRLDAPHLHPRRVAGDGANSTGTTTGAGVHRPAGSPIPIRYAIGTPRAKRAGSAIPPRPADAPGRSRPPPPRADDV